jgi:catechol 2,3-dioxygenase-like lactoylglutathione lyase family enzyme
MPMRSEHEAPRPSVGNVETKLEVVVLPVSDVDRAKRFYGNLGWRLDADFTGADFRVVQLTPPGSSRGRGRSPDEAAHDAAHHVEHGPSEPS